MRHKKSKYVTICRKTYLAKSWMEKCVVRHSWVGSDSTFSMPVFANVTKSNNYSVDLSFVPWTSLNWRGLGDEPIQAFLLENNRLHQNDRIGCRWCPFKAKRPGLDQFIHHRLFYHLTIFNRSSFASSVRKVKRFVRKVERLPNFRLKPFSWNFHAVPRHTQQHRRSNQSQLVNGTEWAAETRPYGSGSQLPVCPSGTCQKKKNKK